jgi:hypothetical protein
MNFVENTGLYAFAQERQMGRVVGFENRGIIRRHVI